ncbi:hypothetical protein [Nocardioides jiangxiensis]|uniref:SGNH hydrolase-type esterase domain-containing protein n=1 Tax=Nocardioides jiangxiensis TaxID=3064524 RepID=A0ABT9B0S5_9ACTN|nr:hypothetical protein [Nocardioides sp. WY-20]MDO7867853.1 hypothetical protein [Nocardioides sp. WY-20]
MQQLKHHLVGVLNRTPAMDAFRTARGVRDEYVDPQVRQLRSVVAEMRAGQIDVLILGDSTTTFFGRDDADPRRLPEMLQAELGRDVRLRLVAGAGYHPGLYAEFVRVLGTLEQRPRAVVVSRAIRTSGRVTHVARHPEYGYERSIAALAAIRDADSRMRAFSRANRRTEAETAAFHALEVETRWQQARTIGEFLEKVRGRRGGAEDIDQQRALFDYFHGETFTERHVDRARLLGERLRAYGVPVVHYWPSIPWQRGETYFPGEFRAHCEQNFAVLRPAFDDALGDLGLTAEGPFDTPDDEFIDAADGSEHWNDKGRARIAKQLAACLHETGALGR